MAMVRIELRDAASARSEDPAPGVATLASNRSMARRILPYAAMIVVALVTGLAVWRVRQPPMISRPLVRFSIDLLGTPPPLTLARHPIAISPDGSRVVYV